MAYINKSLNLEKLNFNFTFAPHEKKIRLGGFVATYWEICF